VSSSDEHYSYTKHNCAKAYQKDNQVPVCPLCNKPIPVGLGQEPDYVVGAHIDNDCQSDPAKTKRKVFTNKCSVKGCKVKEVVPVVCDKCHLNFCLRHRHTLDHQCQGDVKTTAKQKVLGAALARQEKRNGNMSNALDMHGNMVSLRELFVIKNHLRCCRAKMRRLRAHWRYPCKTRPPMTSF
jgi:hypothetical protein